MILKEYIRIQKQNKQIQREVLMMMGPYFWGGRKLIPSPKQQSIARKLLVAGRTRSRACVQVM
jgi:hypothetical protein